MTKVAYNKVTDKQGDKVTNKVTDNMPSFCIIEDIYKVKKN